jgi:hypothetical protein
VDVNDVNDMNNAKDDVDEPRGTVEKAARSVLDRRTMLKAAVATGTVAAVWVAPRIETFGFAPAFAATMCTVTNDENDDLQTNQSGNTYVSFNLTGCGQSLGSSGNNAPDTITLDNPTTTCTSFTVRTQPLDCTTGPAQNRFDPDISGFAVVPYSSVGACACTITAVFVFKPGSTRATPDFTFTSMANPFAGCPTGSSTNGPTGPGIQVNFSGVNCPLPSQTRMAVQITCSTTGSCT